MFDYQRAFSRNLGWVTEHEQQILRTKRVAIAGLGGVGGSHLLTLTRLGIGAFHIADFDVFEVANFNRQAGASTQSLGRPKVDVLCEMAQNINPEVRITPFPQGVTETNVTAFLADVDVYVDGLDFFAIAARELVFAEAARRGIPSVTAAPLGMSAAMLCFAPGKMSFEQYFRLSNCSKREKELRLLVGVAPRMLHLKYLAIKSSVSLEDRRAPSTAMGCELAAGMVGSQVLKILLRRTGLVVAPHGLQFDAYRGRIVRTYRPWGNRNPIQRFLLSIARMIVPGASPTGSQESASTKTLSADTKPMPMPAETQVRLDPALLHQRLTNSAVLAPSADNHHRFVCERIVNGIRLRSRQTPPPPGEYHRALLNLISYGAVSENLILEARKYGIKLTANWLPRGKHDDLIAEFLFAGTAEHSAADLELAEMIKFRHTNRRFYSGKELSPSELERLSNEVTDIEDVELRWCDSPDTRSQLLRLVRVAETERFRSKYLHHELFSAVRFDVGWKTKVDQGLPPGSLEVEPGMKGMFAALRHWHLMRLLTWTGTHHMLGLRAAYFPCRLAPHLGVISSNTHSDIEFGAIAVGRAFQRLWLRATQMGLALQPLAAAAVLPFIDVPDGPSTNVKQTLRDGWTKLYPEGQTPLIVFRLGMTGPPSLTTGREPLENYLQTAD